MTDRILKLLTWPAALFVAGILLWYEQYKLTGSAGSVWLFTVLSDWVGLHGFEKPFRLGVAGAALALGIMSGAIFFHLVSPLGIDPYGDGGVLFTQACEVWLCSAFILFAWRREAGALVRRWTGPPLPRTG